MQLGKPVLAQVHGWSVATGDAGPATVPSRARAPQERKLRCQGWMLRTLHSRIRKHPESGYRYGRALAGLWIDGFTFLTKLTFDVQIG